MIVTVLNILVSLRTKSATIVHYENMPIHIEWKFYHQKRKWKFSDQKFWFFFHISAQNIECGYLLEPPNEYPEYMILSKNKKNNVYLFKPQFYYIKVRLNGVKII